MSDRVIITKEKLKQDEEYIICARFDEKRMIEVQIHKEGKETILGNIYIGRVANIVENLQAAFIEIDKGYSCFYPLKDLTTPYFTKKQGKKPLCIGDELIVEVVKESVKTKPPMVSTNLNFTGKYLVLTTENKNLGISKKISKEERKRLREFIEPHLSKEFGLIVRTNAKDAEEETILKELETLKQEFFRCIQDAKHRMAYTALRKAEPFYKTFLKGLYMPQVERITTDLPELKEDLLEYQKALPKEEADKIHFYEDSLVSLSALYSLKQELARALEKKVWLPGGGYLIIEPTEALTVIDVNSGKNIRKKEKDEMILTTNLEAAEEIARQLILRNISGICIIDFIDMKNPLHQEELLHFLKLELKKDKIPTSLVDITRLGLVELTRKKVKKSIKEQLQGDDRNEK